MTKFDTYSLELRNLIKSDALGTTDLQGFTLGCFSNYKPDPAPVELVHVRHRGDWTNSPVVHDHDPFAGLSWPTGWLNPASTGKCSAHYELGDVVKYALGEPGTLYSDLAR